MSRSSKAVPDLIAAGAVVVRKGGDVLLVHRPKYDDWSFPKGKQDAGEHITATAVREVHEETGVRIRLGRPLRPQLYAVSGGRAKQVHYWVARVRGDDDVSGYEPNKEIDDVRWFNPGVAHARLTYSDDVALLDQLAEEPRRTGTVVVLRHARARKRKTWKGDDARRPLTAVGHDQARLLAPALAAYGVTRAISSPSTRCVQTVAPYVDSGDFALERVEAISEEFADVAGMRALAHDVLHQRSAAVICSHRPVLPDLLTALGVEEEPLSPGELVVVHHRKARIVATERHLVR